MIKSVHDFVRRREQARETVGVDQLIESVLPLVRLQARKSGARIEVDVRARPPRVRVRPHDGRAGAAEPHAQRHPGDAGRRRRGGACCASRVRRDPAAVGRAQRDRPGPRHRRRKWPQRLFTPFFTTRRPKAWASACRICRTVDRAARRCARLRPPAHDPAARGAEFRFTLPAAAPHRPHDTAPIAPAAPRLISA